MKPFNRNQFDRFMDRIKHLNIQTLEDTYDKAGGNVVNIRHDVDDDLAASVHMARIEADLGIHATYFILDTAPYWDRTLELKAALVLLQGYGHNIGWHNNAISNHLRTGKPVWQCVSEPLADLREFAPVIGTASHGDPLCHEHRYLNYYTFKESQPHPDYPNLMIGEGLKMEDFGLLYEAYHVGHTHYLSDAGGQWNREPFSYVELFERQGGKLIINIHPQWWAL